MIAVAIATTAVNVDGSIVTLREGDAWDANDPIVAQYPDLFSIEAGRQVRRTRPYIEEASARPGERRGGRR